MTVLDGLEERSQVGDWRIPTRVAAVAAPLVTCGVFATVRGSVPDTAEILVLVLWVVAAAATGDRVAGLLAAVSGGVWFDFFLTEPYLRFSIAKSDDIETVVLLVLIGVGVSEIALWGHRQSARAARRAGYLDGVLGAARMASEADAPVAVLLDLVGRQITEVLGADSCRFVAGPVHDARIALLDHDGVVTRGGNPVDVDRVGLPWNEYLALPVSRGSRTFGHFLVTATEKITYPSREQRRIAVLLADQVATAVATE